MSHDQSAVPRRPAGAGPDGGHRLHPVRLPHPRLCHKLPAGHCLRADGRGCRLERHRGCDPARPPLAVRSRPGRGDTQPAAGPRGDRLLLSEAVRLGGGAVGAAGAGGGWRAAPVLDSTSTSVPAGLLAPALGVFGGDLLFPELFRAAGRGRRERGAPSFYSRVPLAVVVAAFEPDAPLRGL